MEEIKRQRQRKMTSLSPKTSRRNKAQSQTRRVRYRFGQKFGISRWRLRKRLSLDCKGVCSKL